MKALKNIGIFLLIAIPIALIAHWVDFYPDWAIARTRIWLSVGIGAAVAGIVLIIKPNGYWNFGKY